MNEQTYLLLSGRSHLEYEQALDRMDRIAKFILKEDPSDWAHKQYKGDRSWLRTNGFDPDALSAIDLLDEETVKCPRCCKDVGQVDRIGTDLVCPGCFNTIPEKELREILSRPKCLQEVPH